MNKSQKHRNVFLMCFVFYVRGVISSESASSYPLVRLFNTKAEDVIASRDMRVIQKQSQGMG